MSVLSRRRMYLIAVILLLVAIATNAFVVLPQKHRLTRPKIFNSNNPAEEFQDFDFVIGDEGGEAPPDPLQQRLREVQKDELRRDAQISKNWKTGNWGVRGFSLDKNDDLLDTAIPVHVSMVQASLNPNQVVVGRTDGSVCFVTLGNEYLTQFVGKLTAKETSNETISVQSELVPQERGSSQDAIPGEVPFQVARQFQAHDSSIIAMVQYDSHDEPILFTASEGSGEVKVWSLPDDEEQMITPLRSLTGVHSDNVVALKTLVPSPDEEDESLLFSASCDGSIALWNVHTGDLMYKCQIMLDVEEAASIACADVSQSIIYLGMASGHVVGYNLQDMVASTGFGDTCPLPSGQFLAHEEGVTAIHCAGEGTLARSSSDTSSSLLLTGSSEGVVKQWEMLSRKVESSSPSLKLEHWPRMATQRMQKRAHLFQDHKDAITALCSVDSTKFLSASVDGSVRAWSPSTGKELFRMDGFTEQLKSLCLQDRKYLVTDGMDHLVCVHDFDVEATEVQDGYELDW